MALSFSQFWISETFVFSNAKSDTRKQTHNLTANCETNFNTNCQKKLTKIRTALAKITLQFFETSAALDQIWLRFPLTLGHRSKSIKTNVLVQLPVHGFRSHLPGSFIFGPVADKSWIIDGNLALDSLCPDGTWGTNYIRTITVQIPIRLPSVPQEKVQLFFQSQLLRLSFSEKVWGQW